MKHLIVAAVAALTAGSALAQQDNLLNVRAEARLDYQRVWDGSHADDANSGFEGKYLNLQIDGSIVSGLTYSWRQRLNKNHNDRNFFDATDWVYLSYDMADWTFAGGKQVVCIGGYEYDRAPINIYNGSVFWNNISCYQIGASASYRLNPANSLTAQWCESPFFNPANRNLYSYNLMWNGKFNSFSTIYSINMLEYKRGCFINYIALGNRYDYNRFTLELDLMNRAAGHQAFFLKDCSLMTELSYRPGARWNVHLKYTYDVNHSGTNADLTVLNGTELNMLGAGVEFYPLNKAKQHLRLHADLYRSWGKNTNADDVMQNKTTFFSVGVKWDMDLLSLKRK